MRLLQIRDLEVSHNLCSAGQFMAIHCNSSGGTTNLKARGGALGVVFDLLPAVGLLPPRRAGLPLRGADGILIFMEFSLVSSLLVFFSS